MSTPAESASPPSKPASTAASSQSLSSLIGADATQVKARRRRHLLWGLVFVIVLGAGGSYGWSVYQKASTSHEPPYSTTSLARDDISLSVTATGNLEPTNEVTVGSELSGIVQEVYVEANDHVTRGQPLAKLDTRKLEQQVQASRASLASQQARVAQAQATLEEVTATLGRQQELERLSGGMLPSRADMASAVATVARAKADVAAAQASVDSAKAQVEMGESDLSKAVIQSPIDGVVLTRSIEPGQTVAASFNAPELFVIAEKLEHMKLKIYIAEADIARLQKGQNATFTVDAWPGRSFTAKVTRVAYGSQVKDNVVTYETELEVPNDDLSLRPGMTATADVDVAVSQNTFLVPVEALRFMPEAGSEGDARLAFGTSSGGSFVDRLVPMRRRPSRSGGSAGSRRSGGSRAAVVTGRIWVLPAGTADLVNDAPQPERIDVRIGLSDGRRTEVFSDKLQEGLEVILRNNPAYVSK